MSPIDLHLVSWNRPKMTELVIRTIHRNTKRENFRLCVLDNGSEEDTQVMLSDLQDNGLIDELYLSLNNYGLEAARQKMLIDMTESPYFICVDNDCLPPPIENGLDWIERLVLLMENNENYGAISCRTQVMIGTGNIFENADNNGDELVDFPHPGGSLRIMRTDVVSAIGGWDRPAAGRGAEERYICGKLSDVGYKTAFAAKIPCLHLFGTRGFNGTDRWGYDVHNRPEDTGHSDISHPALTNGDDKDEIIKYSGLKLAEAYYG